MVAVAQLVESRIVIPVVVGSSPISHPNKINDLAHFIVRFFIFLEYEFHFLEYKCNFAPILSPISEIIGAT